MLNNFIFYKLHILVLQNTVRLVNGLNSQAILTMRTCYDDFILNSTNIWDTFIIDIKLIFNNLTNPIALVTFWFIYIYTQKESNFTVLGFCNVFADIHSGAHRHSYIYRYMCPIILFIELTNLMCFLSDDFIFYIFAVFILLWSINERVISSHYSKSGLVSVYNSLLVINFFNPFNRFIIFHDCGNYNNHKFINRRNIIMLSKHLDFINRPVPAFY